MIVESVFYDRILIAKFPESLVLMFFCWVDASSRAALSSLSSSQSNYHNPILTTKTGETVASYKIIKINLACRWLISLNNIYN